MYMYVYTSSAKVLVRASEEGHVVFELLSLTQSVVAPDCCKVCKYLEYVREVRREVGRGEGEDGSEDQYTTSEHKDVVTDL